MIRRALSRLRPVLRDRRALGAVEFALAAPFMILIYIGGFQLMDAISAYRKVTITDRTLADLTTQSTALTYAQADSILSGAKQVMTPYSTTGATLVITQIKFDANGNATIDWSRSNDGTTLLTKDINVPPSIVVPNSYIILSQITYHYTPRIGGKLIGELTFTDHIFMNPRLSNSIPLTAS